MMTPERASKDLKEMAEIVKNKTLSLEPFDVSAAVLDTIHSNSKFESLKEFYGGHVVQIAKDVLLIIKD